ncbi:MAG: thiamine pyrophosphate-binding protein [Actinomycetaceae bacterium]
MRVADVIGRTLVALGVTQMFGVVGSGNFHTTNAMISAGARFVATRHEAGAGIMADAYGRVTGEVPAVSLHQGCGLTNAMTALTEAAKSGTPLVAFAGDTPPSARHTSNFWIDQTGALEALGVPVARIHSAATAVEDTVAAVRLAVVERTAVVLNMPLDVQEEDVDVDRALARPIALPTPPAPAADGLAELARLLSEAERPVIVAGRGARGAREQIERLAEVSGALVATSAVARGLFAGNDWSLDVMGGFSSPTVADLVLDADLVVGFGLAFNRWTSRNGEFTDGTRLVHVDIDPAAIGKHRPVALGIVSDAGLAAAAAAELVAPRTGYRTPEVRRLLDSGAFWPDVEYEDTSTDERIDPRTLTLALERMIPRERVVVTDAGNATGYPANFLSVPDEKGFILPLAFQSVGLGLGSAVGAAIARPDRRVVAGIGDGGFMMSLVELDTAVRERVNPVIVVYNDSAYGAEVHHFDGDDMQTVRFPDTDLAAIARGFGCEGFTVRTRADLDALAELVPTVTDRPIVVDAKITEFRSWVEEHVFQGDK